jgi:pimeloyl-ACP methyl ester carboxylesterase
MGGTRDRLKAWLSAALVCLAAPATAAAPASAAPATAAPAQPSYAPLNQPGPALTPSVAQLKASLSCEPSVKNANVEPVLLNPGTSTTATENFGWNWEPALQKLGIPYCAYDPPHQALGPVDVSGEYLVYAIRTAYALAGRPIAIIGHSQGGMSMRWALRFWPDTRKLVADVVGLEPSNHGTTILASPDCALLGCPAADWDQIYESPFIQALNSGAETFAGIGYTSTFSVDDEAVHPDSGPGNCSSCLSTGAGQISNVELQSVCPHDTAGHVEGGTTDPVAYAVGIDAITHPGPADPARISRSVCSELLMPGVLTPQSAAAGLTLLGPGLGSLGVIPGPLTNPISGAPVLHSAPALPCYVFADCAPSVPLNVTVTPRDATRDRRARLSVLVTATVSGITLPVPQATVSIGTGRALRTNGDGHAAATMTLGQAGRLLVTATDREYFAGHAIVRVR